jgi:protocatechuate 3,4-dioxygenase, alpha subunit
VTLRPGPLPRPGGTVEAPHLDVSVFARGLPGRPGGFRFDIQLQGRGETVFFEV